MIILLLALKTGQGDQTNLLVDIYGKKGSLLQVTFTTVKCDLKTETQLRLNI